MVTFQVINKSAQVDPASLDPMCAALTQALNGDFMPAWNPGGQALVTTATTPPPNATITLVDQAPVANAEGYHEAPGGVADIVIQVPDVPAGQLSVVISHELFETVADWLAILLVQGPWAPPVAYEVADPVEDRYYTVANFPISNFVLPHWFVDGSTGPWDKMGVLQGPFKLSTGGYVALADGTVTWGGEARQAAGLKPWRRGGQRVAGLAKPAADLDNEPTKP